MCAVLSEHGETILYKQEILPVVVNMLLFLFLASFGEHFFLTHGVRADRRESLWTCFHEEMQQHPGGTFLTLNLEL